MGMKKVILISASLISSMFLFGCGDNANYTGCWKGEANMIFEVLSENNQDFTIRNVNGDLSATIQEGKLCGKNTLDMPYCMSVKGDSAYYEFGGITTGYARISKEEYEDIFASQIKAAVE